MSILLQDYFNFDSLLFSKVSLEKLQTTQTNEFCLSKSCCIQWYAFSFYSNFPKHFPTFLEFLAIIGEEKFHRIKQTKIFYLCSSSRRNKSNFSPRRKRKMMIALMCVLSHILWLSVLSSSSPQCVKTSKSKSTTESNAHEQSFPTILLVFVLRALFFNG